MSETSQAYYWSAEWQANEQESLDELDAGRGLRFDSAQEVIEYLQSDEKDI